jgi:hypothetical protein
MLRLSRRGSGGHNHSGHEVDGHDGSGCEQRLHKADPLNISIGAVGVVEGANKSKGKEGVPAPRGGEVAKEGGK